MTKAELDQLAAKISDGTATDEEIVLYNDWFNTQAAFEVTATGERPDTIDLKKAIYNKISHQIDLIDRRNKVRSLLRIAAAASVILVITVGIWFAMHDSKGTSGNGLNAKLIDVMPGKQGATLTLGNGRKIRLSDAANGQLAKEAGITISKLPSGQIIYNVSAAAGAGNATNVLTTNNGETYQVTLPDGSNVWLNAASSLTYNAALIREGKRSVKLTGEGYFEIAKDKRHPFYVISGEQQIKVLGTHFNVNAYGDEKQLTTTLLEGAVEVKEANGQTALLKPDEQARFINGKLNTDTVNTAESIAWKNGVFSFNHTNLYAMMRQLSRWYDVEVVYEGEIPDRAFFGKINRNYTLMELLQILHMGNINFELQQADGNDKKARLIIRP